MELALTLGEPPARLAEKIAGLAGGGGRTSTGLKLGFCIGIEEGENRGDGNFEAEEREERRDSVDPPVQLNLLPFAPAPRQGTLQLGFPWSSENRTLEPSTATRVFDVNQVPSAEEVAAMSSPNSTLSSFHADVAGGVVAAAEMDRSSPRASDDDDNGGSRKKLRLSKEQSVFLEESFKEHNTLNPKQKLALAKQLNLRPRQVEVWFQNRRARTKLKQTEVDCEYLKRCCETLREENRRLQKELAELRALKTSQPFYMQLPATTLSMCPSCERVSSNSTSVAGNGGGSASHPTATAEKSLATVPPFVASLFPKARLYPFGSPPRTPAHQSSAAS